MKVLTKSIESGILKNLYKSISLETSRDISLHMYFTESVLNSYTVNLTDKYSII